MVTMNLDNYWTLPEIAKELQISRQGVWKAVQAKRLKAKFHFGQWLVTEKDFKKFATLRQEED